MGIMMAPDQFDRYCIAGIYRDHRRKVNELVALGNLMASEADTEWASRVAAQLTEIGYRVPKAIFGLLK